MENNNFNKVGGSLARLEVLNASLLLEAETSRFLASLFRIEDYQSSNTLGTSGSALSFKQKTELLIDIGTLSNELKSKFQTFTEIRNKFMHVASATSYETCLSLIKGGRKKLLDYYEHDENLPEEVKLRQNCTRLAQELIKAVSEIESIVTVKKVTDEKTMKMAQAASGAFMALLKLKTRLKERVDIELQKSNVFDENRIDQLFGDIFNHVIDIIEEPFKGIEVYETMPEEFKDMPVVRLVGFKLVEKKKGE